MEEWETHYCLGETFLKKGNVELAYKNGMKCFKIIKNSFEIKTDPEKLELIEQYYHTMILLKQCSDYQKCRGCAEKHLLTAISSYYKMAKYYSCSLEVSKQLHKYILKLYRYTSNFYKENEMSYELASLNEKHKKEYIKNQLKVLHSI